MKFKDILRSIALTAKLSLTTSRTWRRPQQHSATTKVIISLTSIPSRLPALHWCILSLLRQNTAYEKIILWLHRDLQHSLPVKLSRLISDEFEIRYCDTKEPHRKLVETLKAYPNSHIVTCDDDMIYPACWLQRLLAEHYRHPEAIVAHMCRRIRVENQEILPYRRWRGESPGTSSLLTVALGWGGILYPPQSLHPLVVDRERYMELAPKADDLWFKFMSILNNTEVRKTSEPKPEPTPILGTQTASLSQDNIAKDENRSQLFRLMHAFDIDFADVGQ